MSELAEIMKVPPSQIVQLAFKELGLMVTVNQRLDFDQIELIASEFGFEAVREEEYAADATIEPEVEAEEAQRPRPPIVTIMGHVDHGKTSLLDYIRKTNVVAGEAGGITQHIGAYHVTLPGGRAITFLDTPGHQAFTAMRARGAQVTDIVVLVVAADDQVMPQTVEAISHAKNAGVPMIVAINKIDLPTANVQKVKQDLLQHQVVLEDFGGQVLCTAISAKKGTGIDALLEQILLQAEILDLKANPDRRAAGTVLEASLDPGKGPLATILVQKGTLRVGDNFICGKFSGRVRALFDERGKIVKEAGPSIPVQILGFEGVPSAGDSFPVVTDAVEAREIAQKRQRLEREAQNRRGGRGGTLEDIGRALKEGQVSALRIIIKADQGGPGRSAGRRAGPAQHHRSAGGRRAPRRRRHHRERRPARQGVGGHHPRLPRPARRQRPRHRRAGTGRCPDLPHHLRGRRGREERPRGAAQAGGEGNRAGRGRGAAAVQGQQGRHHRRLHGPERHHPAHRQGPRDPRRRHRSTPAVSRASSGSRTT